MGVAVKSLTHRTLLKMAVRVAVVIVAVTAATYVHVTDSLTATALDNLGKYVSERAQRESQLFQLGEGNVTLLRDWFRREEAAQLAGDPSAEYERLFARWPDGATRRRHGEYDINIQAGAYAAPDHPHTHAFKARLVAMDRVVSAFGPAWQKQFATSHITFLDNTVSIYWPKLDWAASWVAGRRVKDESVVHTVSPKSDPTRGPVWAGPWSDGIAEGWWATCLTPLDDAHGNWVGFVGTSTSIDAILERSNTVKLDGTVNMILRPDGLLVTHPDLMGEIKTAKGEYDIARMGSAHLKSVLAQATGQKGTAIVEHPGYDEYLGIARIAGPEWYLVTVFPKSLVSAPARKAAQVVLGLGLLSLAIELLMLYLVLRRGVTQPLARLIEATDKVAAGDRSVRVESEGEDELARLAGSFNSMTTTVARQEQALADTLARLERAVEGSDSALWEFDIDTRTFFVAPRFHQMLGWDPQQDLYSYWESMIHPDHHQMVMNSFRRHLSDGSPFQVEYRLRKKDGVYIWVQVRGRCIHDAQGKPLMMSGSLTDIEGDKKIEAELAAYRDRLEHLVAARTTELKESEDRFRTLADATSEGIILHAGGVILDGNALLTSMFGHRLDGSHSLAELFAASCRNDALAALDMADPRPLEFTCLRPDGREFPVEVRTKRALRKGRPILVTAIRDLTLRKELTDQLRQLADRAQAASQAKSDLLATMSHEIRTPLNGLLGMAQVLRDSPLSPEQAEQADTICASGEALQSLLNDMLDLSKLEAGRLGLAPRPFALAPVVTQVMGLFQPRAAEHGIELSWRMDDAIPDLIVGDPLRLRQIITNLVGNAVKFTETGAVRLNAWRSGESGGDLLRMEIIDTGIGIPPEVQARLFEPFAQADASVAGRFGGTGLGLAICKHLVELHQGRIGVDSVDGGGSRFWFELPLIEDNGAAPAAPPPTADTQSPERPLRILLAEDNAVGQKVMSLYLERRGHTVAVADNGLMAAEAVKAADFDVVLMDMQMPVMGGLDAARAIRALKGAKGQVPIVALTANAFDTDADACLAAGMNSFISKPVNFDAMIQLLARITTRTVTMDVAEPVPEVEPPPPPAFDLARLQAVTRLIGEDGIAEVRSRFDMLSEQLRETLADSQDLDEWAGLAHGAKGCASYLGLTGLTAICSELELACKESNRSIAETLAARIPTMLADARQWLDSRESVG